LENDRAPHRSHPGHGEKVSSRSIWQITAKPAPQARGGFCFGVALFRAFPSPPDNSPRAPPWITVRVCRWMTGSFPLIFARPDTSRGCALSGISADLQRTRCRKLFDPHQSRERWVGLVVQWRADRGEGILRRSARGRSDWSGQGARHEQTVLARVSPTTWGGMTRLFCGNTNVDTPHLDALARGGAVFTQASASAPTCAPARGGDREPDCAPSSQAPVAARAKGFLAARSHLGLGEVGRGAASEFCHPCSLCDSFLPN
jgi:hypothetical protein